MQVVFEVIFPVFGVLVLGYAAALSGKFSAAANRGLSLFVFNFALPIMVFRAIARADLPGQIPWGYLVSYFIGAFVVFGCAMVIARAFFGRRPDEQGVLGLSAAFYNGGMLGIPLVLTAYGPAASVPLFTLIACHSLVILPPTTALIEWGRGSHPSFGKLLLTLIKSILSTPLIWGLMTGLCFALLELRLPQPVDVVAKGMGDAAIPCALFALGASLRTYRLGAHLLEPIIMVALKTLVHPLLVWLLATQVFHLSELWVAVAVTLAALPTGVTPYLFAQRYKLCIDTAASTIFISTLFSVLTLSGLLFLFEAR